MLRKSSARPIGVRGSRRNGRSSECTPDIAALTRTRRANTLISIVTCRSIPLAYSSKGSLLFTVNDLGRNQTRGNPLEYPFGLQPVQLLARAQAARQPRDLQIDQRRA